MKSFFSFLFVCAATFCALLAWERNPYIAATVLFSLMALCHAADNRQ